MTYVSLENLAILINGKMTEFFKIFRSLCKGCVVLPLFFIMVIEELNKGIQEVMEISLIIGCRVTRKIISTHLMFVDDLLYLQANIQEWHTFHQIFSKFGKDLGLFMNKERS